MVIRVMEVSQDVGNQRAVALLHAIRDPSIGEYLPPEDRQKVEDLGAKYHTDLTHQDALWMAKTIAATVVVEPPRTKKVEMEDGAPPHGVRQSG